MHSRTISVVEAVDMIPDGTTIMCGGLLNCGSAHRIIEVLIQKDIEDPTTIDNNYNMATGPNGEGFYGAAELMHNHQVKYVITTHVGVTLDVGTQGVADRILTVDLVPQGTLVETIRADGADLDGVPTPTDVGTIVKDPPFCLDKQAIGGRDYLLMKPIRTDSALINDHLVNKFGSIWYKDTTRNFNIVMTTVADVVIAEADSVVEIDDIQPENVVTFDALVNYIVDGGNA